MFFRISTHSTATPGIPPAPTVLERGSSHGRPGVEPRAFTSDCLRPPTRPLRPVIPDNARALRITAAAGTELAGASSPGTVSQVETWCSSRATAVYTPRGVLPHAASLRQPCGHCARFPTAASRRSLGRLSVPMWLATLSGQLPVVALVVSDTANELIGREPLAPPRKFPSSAMPPKKRMRYYPAVGPAIPRGAAGSSRVTHPFAGHRRSGALDLHVLSTPPAFVLSQDQTLQ